MKFLKKSLLLITLVTVMGIIKTEQSSTDKLAQKQLDIIEKQEQERKELRAQWEKEDIARKAEQKLLKQQRKQEEKNAVQSEINDLDKKIDRNHDTVAAFLFPFIGLSVFTFACFLNHIGFEINFADAHKAVTV